MTQFFVGFLMVHELLNAFLLLFRMLIIGEHNPVKKEHNFAVILVCLKRSGALTRLNQSQLSTKKH